MLVKVFGLFECLTALLIFFGDGLGGFLLFLSLAFEGCFDYHSNIMTICQWNVEKQLQVILILYVKLNSLQDSFSLLVQLSPWSVQKDVKKPMKHAKKEVADLTDQNDCFIHLIISLKWI